MVIYHSITWFTCAENMGGLNRKFSVAYICTPHAIPNVLKTKLGRIESNNMNHFLNRKIKTGSCVFKCRRILLRYRLKMLLNHVNVPKLSYVSTVEPSFISYSKQSDVCPKLRIVSCELDNCNS